MALNFESRLTKLAPVHVWTYLNEFMLPSGGPQTRLFSFLRIRATLAAEKSPPEKSTEIFEIENFIKTMVQRIILQVQTSRAATLRGF